MIRLFLRGWLIVTLTAMNVVFISSLNFPLAFVTGFGISATWWLNAGSASDDRSWRALVAYATGAAVGTMTGMVVGEFLR